MPSVEVVWKGRCVNRQDQQALCEQLLQLSEISNRKFNAYFKEQVNNICFNEEEAVNKYLITSSVFNKELPKGRVKEVEKGIYLTEDVSLFGLEFPLYDPRNYTPPFGLGTGNRMSFVFTRSENTALDGWLVQAYSVNDQHRLGAMAQTVLTSPTLDLRYYLENWIGKFLGWVKHFYVPDLYYWHHGDYEGYDSFRGKIAKKSEFANETFEELLKEFSENAEGFTELVEGFRRKNLTTAE